MADFAAEHLIRQLGDQLASLARQIADVRAGQGAPQLGNSSVENSHVRFNDSTGSQRVQVGLQQDGGHGVRIDQGYIQGVDASGVMRTNIDGTTGTVYGNTLHLRGGGPSAQIIESGLGDRVEFMIRNSSGVDLTDSRMIYIRRGDGIPCLVASAQSSGINFGAGSVAVTTGDPSTYGPIGASAFNVSSSVEVKKRLGPPQWEGGPLGVVRRAGVELFQYHTELDPPPAMYQPESTPLPGPSSAPVRIGPMWEQLPAELQHRDLSGVKHVAAHDMAGLALAAITQLADEKDSQLAERDKQIAELTARLERLETR